MTAAKALKRLPLAALLVLCAFKRSPEDPAPGGPKGEWDKEYTLGAQYSAMYNIRLKVKELATSENQIDKIIAAGGGKAFGAPYANPRSERQRVLYYQLPAKTAEKTAKKMLDLGEVLQYTASHPMASGGLEEIDKKIKDLTAEMDGNKEPLAKMPIASALLQGKLDKLKSAKESYESGADKAMLYVYLTLD